MLEMYYGGKLYQDSDRLVVVRCQARTSHLGLEVKQVIKKLLEIIKPSEEAKQRERQRTGRQKKNQKKNREDIPSLGCQAVK